MQTVYSSHCEDRMSPTRIALANLPVPETPDQSVVLVGQAIGQAAESGAQVICFPECYVPGYRLIGKQSPPPNPEFLEYAYASVAAAPKPSRSTAFLGPGGTLKAGLRITALVLDEVDAPLGFQ